MELQAPRSEEHLETLAQMFAMTFTTYWDRRRYVHDGYIANSDYDWQASRIGLVDGEVATHFGVWDRQMRIGDAAVRVAAIGAVATLEHHRKKGLMAETASACVAGLDAGGYDLSLLFGISDFYHRFGYVRSFSECEFKITARDISLPDEPPSFEATEPDIERFSGLYNAENSSVTGTWVRPTFNVNRKPKKFKFYRCASGYLCAQRVDDKLQIVDCAGDPQELLFVAVQIAQKEFCPEISFPFLPRRSRMGEYLQTIAHRFEYEQEPNGGPMFKMVNLVSTTRKLEAVWTRRLAAAGWGSYSGTILLASDDQAVGVTITSGAVENIEHVEKGVNDAATSGDQYDGVLDAGRSLVRFYVGDDVPDSIIRQSKAVVRGDARYLVPVLFPFEEPSTILWDRF